MYTPQEIQDIKEKDTVWPHRFYGTVMFLSGLALGLGIGIPVANNIYETAPAAITPAMDMPPGLADMNRHLLEFNVAILGIAEAGAFVCMAAGIRQFAREDEF